MRLVHADRRWSGRCIIAASGPSLTEDVAALCRGERVIAVNDAYRLLPYADVLYACDSAWWDLHRSGPIGWVGERWTSHGLSPKNDKRAIADSLGLHVIAGEDRPGFSRDPARIHYASNSGFQAVNLAILFGADPIILVGFDMRAVDRKSHFFGEHKAPLRGNAQFGQWCAKFAKAAEMLGNSPRIVNCTPQSALTCFPMMPLPDALQMAEAA
jgi:hypothetical protein